MGEDAGCVWRYYNPAGSDAEVSYTGVKEDMASKLINADELKGNKPPSGDPDIVAKVYVLPFDAVAVRLHPTAWSGASMAMRAEVFVCNQGFDWSFIQDYIAAVQPVQYSANSQFAATEVLQCDALMSTAGSAFHAWS